MIHGNARRVHPAAAAFPLLAGQELDDLVADIKKRGLLHPIVLDTEGRILDGRNRLRACKKAKVEPRFTTYRGADQVDFIVAVNMRRRHLTPSQVSCLTLALLPFYEAEAKKRLTGRPSKAAEGSAPGRSISGKASEHAARATGAAPRSVERAKRVQRWAPDLYDEVVAGNLDLKLAEVRLKRRLLDEKEAAARRTTFDATVADAEGPGWKLLHGDFSDRLADIRPGSLDCILTDVPYSADALPLWSDLSKLAAVLLKRQGFLIALSGQLYLPEVLARLTEHLHYGWMYAQPMPGGNLRIQSRRVFQGWKPWIVCTNGPWPVNTIKWHRDQVVPAAVQKGFRWEQPGAPAEYLLQRLTAAGDLVVDPFAGHGIYGAVAVSNGRRFIGVEMDKGRFKKAVEALRAVKSGPTADQG